MSEPDLEEDHSAAQETICRSLLSLPLEDRHELLVQFCLSCGRHYTEISRDGEWPVSCQCWNDE